MDRRLERIAGLLGDNEEVLRAPAMITEIKELKPEVFDGMYGKVLLKDNQMLAPMFKNDELAYWTNQLSLEKNMDHHVGVLTEFERPVILEKLERHVKSQEVFIPVSGVSMMFFAPAGYPDDPNGVPELRSIECFKIVPEHVMAILVDRGVWHYPAFPISSTATQLVILRDGLEGDDIQTVQLSEAVGVESDELILV